MQLISDEYVRLNKQLHEVNKHYGTIGMRHIQDVLVLAKQVDSEDILDYGCGKSSLARNLPITIKQYDPAITKYAALPVPADIVVCTDVFEHIEPDFLDNVLTHLKDLTLKAGYFTACTCEAKKTLSDGRNAHLIVQPTEWWIEKVSQYFKIVHHIEHDKEVVFIVEPLERPTHA